ncbi:hypothetical protein [Shewanella decolorationis]|uniref:hypothetical protein n=1 Tax=Shewanella decolorationis TaxID=256839 RepID=UPI00105714F7|nr:hypothetical protein [Shewanella decolorationis]
MSKVKGQQSNKTSRAELAKEFLQRAEALGIKASIKGDWVVWKPVLPAEMLLEVPPISNELFKLISTSEISTNG